MSLANLSINVNVNAPNAEVNLRRIGDQAQTSMAQSGAAVQGFERQLQGSANTLRTASQQMGGSMATAAEQIQQSSAKAEVAVERLNKAPDATAYEDFSTRVATAFGGAFGAGFVAAQTYLQKTEEYVTAKAKIIAIGLAAGVLVVGGASIYAAYRIISGSLDFIEGLFTGQSYKSENIDALSAQLAKVKDLKEQLHVTAQEANAFQDAMARLGVNKGDAVAAFDGATKAMRSNGDELKRLGVVYQNEDGSILSQRDVLQNAKRALDEYTEGYDRNAAAAAIGMGSYDQINAALKLNQAEIQASKDRLDEYNLGIGEDTKKAEEAYQQAMRDFRNETNLTGEGIKRVIADAVMPILTDLAVFFKDGFPSAVQFFRIQVARITEAFYIFKTGIYVVAESILGTIEATGAGVAGLAKAVYRAVQGDFSGAAEALTGGYEAAQQRMKLIGANIVTQVENNNKAVRAAFGTDDRAAGIMGGPGSGAKGGKAFVPAPSADKEGEGERRSAFAAFLQDLDRQNKKVSEGEYAMLRLKAAELGAAEGITDLSGAYTRIVNLQRGDGQKAAEEFAEKLRRENAAYAEQTVMLTMTGAALQEYQARLRNQLAVEDAITAARKSGKPLDQQAIDAIRAQGKAQSDANAVLIAKRNDQERAAATGVKRTLANYYDAATNAAAAASNLVSGALQRAEDAFVNFAKTGKLSFSDLFSFMAEEFLRQQIRMSIADFLPGGKGAGGGSILAGAISLFGGFKAGGGPVAGGTAYVVGEQGPELFVPGSSGAIVPNGAMSASGSGPMIDASINGLSVGAGVSLPQVQVMINRALGVQREQIMRTLRQQGGQA